MPRPLRRRQVPATWYTISRSVASIKLSSPPRFRISATSLIPTPSKSHFTPWSCIRPRLETLELCHRHTFEPPSHPYSKIPALFAPTPTEHPHSPWINEAISHTSTAHSKARWSCHRLRSRTGMARKAQPRPSPTRNLSTETHVTRL